MLTDYIYIMIVRSKSLTKYYLTGFWGFGVLGSGFCDFFHKHLMCEIWCHSVTAEERKGVFRNLRKNA